MKTVADLKRRIKPGAVLRLIGASFPHPQLNVDREVGPCNTVGFTLITGEKGRLSHGDWPARSEVEFLAPDQFHIRFATGGSLTYQIVKEAA